MQAETFERSDVMYKIGDLVMYGATGVCRVEAVSEEKFSLEELQMYYVLQPLYQNGRIYAPVENSKVYMRHIISEDDANELIDDMPSVEAEAVKCGSVQQLSKHYQSVIDTHDCRNLIQLAKSIRLKEETANRQNKHLGQIDKKFMKRALSLSELKETWMNKRSGNTVFISARGRTNIDVLKAVLYERVKAIHITRFPYNDFLFQHYETDEEEMHSET